MNALHYWWRDVMYAYCRRRGHREVTRPVPGVGFEHYCRRCESVWYERVHVDLSWDHEAVVGTPGVHA